jgi:hypothetical protein
MYIDIRNMVVSIRRADRYFDDWKGTDIGEQLPNIVYIRFCSTKLQDKYL